LTISDGNEFDKKTSAVPPSLIDFAHATMITNDDLFSKPSAQYAHGDAEAAAAACIDASEDRRE
jgi:hypothetical protein